MEIDKKEIYAARAMGEKLENPTYVKRILTPMEQLILATLRSDECRSCCLDGAEDTAQVFHFLAKALRQLKIAIYINAGHDPNGNPKRGWIIVNAVDGEHTDFVDHAYVGIKALRQAYPGIAEADEIEVKSSLYNSLMKRYGKG